MKRCVAIVGPGPDIMSSVAAVFTTRGWDVRTSAYGPTIPRFAPWRLTKRRLDREYRRSTARAFNRMLAAELKRPSSDLLLVLRGERLSAANQGAIRSADLPLVSWAYDSLSRWPAQQEVAALARHAFYIDEGDSGAFDVPATWLPLGVDAASAVSQVAPSIDVLIAGRVGDLYRRRRSVLIDVGRSQLPERYRFVFVGTTGTRLGDCRLGLSPSIEWFAKSVSSRALGEMIASARICVNVHQDDGVGPVNPMFFEIPGRGVCQITDDAPQLAKWLRPHVEYVPAADDAFVPVIERMLENDDQRRDIAANGQKTVLGEHTYHRRIEMIAAAAGIDL